MAGGDSSDGWAIRARGTVQGVGFRPFVYRLAVQLGLTGRVFNDQQGAGIELFGALQLREEFLRRLRSELPPAAAITSLLTEDLPGAAPGSFTIAHSEPGAERLVSIPPDLKTCPACLAELSDPQDRRFQYAFTNCTLCGPRYTIATNLPYDRPATTMAQFPLCPNCEREYLDVADRRFHAQPIACPSCGPQLQFISRTLPTQGEPLELAVQALQSGKLVAIKGLGGFQVCCAAQDERAVLRLRQAKGRDEKPFAVMMADLAMALRYVELDATEQALLGSSASPIVLARNLSAQPREAALAEGIAAGLGCLGIMLPYTPLHHLLLARFGKPLVMTSGNPSGEPLVIDNEQALQRLDGLADGFLLHNRPIASRADDSVARCIEGKPLLLRRSRGYVPSPVLLSRSIAHKILACGAHQKAAICLAFGDRAYLGPHVGDLDSPETCDWLAESAAHLEGLLGITPDLFACDLHDGFFSTSYAKGRGRVLQVQHHHAHLASVMAEHQLSGPVLGLAFDGTGLGTDGALWGGEFLLAHYDRFERLATFRSLPLAGGETAIRQIWRQAAALLDDALAENWDRAASALFDGISDRQLALNRRQISTGLNTPRSHGLGRYFDAVGALILGRPAAGFEGQTAQLLEAAAQHEPADSYPWSLAQEAKLWQIDLRPMTRKLWGDLARGVKMQELAARFHQTIVEASVETARRLLARTGSLPVVLAGGCFYNARLLAGIRRGLEGSAEVYTGSAVPIGDGGLSLGQAVIASARAEQWG